MIKKIPIAQLRVGMHVHRLDGAWLDHPFWKHKFRLEDPADLALLRNSKVSACWIDTERGVDVAAPQEPLASPRLDARTVAPARPPAPVLQPGPQALAPATRTFDEEMTQAAAVCQRGRVAVMAMLSEARMGRPVDAESCLPLVEEISSSVMRNPGALVSLARLKTKDDYSYMHSMAVCALMVLLGRQLGFDAAGCRSAGLAGLLHDIGKVSIPLEILNKPDKLSPEEYVVISTHPVRGHEMLLEARGVDALVLDVCLHHHERPDGRGYPHALSGDQLSLQARMGSLCDVYDAITSNRPYKVGWDPAESIARMASWKGQFDPVLFQAFVKSLGIYPTGSLVRLESQQLAVVVEQNPLQLAAPVVKVFFSVATEMRVSPRSIDLARPGCADRIVGREALSNWGFQNLDELWLGSEARQRSRAAA